MPFLRSSLAFGESFGSSRHHNLRRRSGSERPLIRMETWLRKSLADSTSGFRELQTVALLGLGAIATASIAPGCVFHHLTGLHCPFCGMLRAGQSLCTGKIEESLTFNPLLLPTVAVIVVAIVSRGKTHYAVWSCRLMTVLLLIFAVLRNVLGHNI